MPEGVFISSPVSAAFATHASLNEKRGDLASLIGLIPHWDPSRWDRRDF